MSKDQFSKFFITEEEEYLIGLRMHQAWQEQLENLNFNREIDNLVEQLSETEQIVIKFIYGIDNHLVKSRYEVGKLINRHPMAVYKIEREALIKLKKLALQSDAIKKCTDDWCAEECSLRSRKISKLKG